MKVGGQVRHQWAVYSLTTQRLTQRTTFSVGNYEDTCNSNVRLHVVSPLVCVLSALKLVPVNTVMSATMPTQR